MKVSSSVQPALKRTLGQRDALETRSIEPSRAVKKSDAEADSKENLSDSSHPSVHRPAPSQLSREHKLAGIAFRGTRYVLDDFVYIRESPTTNMVGQLRRVIARGGDPSHPSWPMVEVQWYNLSHTPHDRYYRKEDLDRAALRLSPTEWASLGENELFTTAVVSKIHADLLNGRCRVWSLSDYEKQSVLGADDLYTRAEYDIEKVEQIYEA